MKRKSARKAAFVEKMARIAWREYPGHFGGALSKALVDPAYSGSQRLDFRISRYSPMAYVQEHVHKVQEQVYHVIEGEGLMELGDRKQVVRKHDFIFVPPGVEHSRAVRLHRVTMPFTDARNSLPAIRLRSLAIATRHAGTVRSR